jgi:hypothetical protein
VGGHFRLIRWNWAVVRREILQQQAQVGQHVLSRQPLAGQFGSRVLAATTSAKADQNHDQTDN